MKKTDINTEEVTRVEVIDDTGRAYVNRNSGNAVEVQLQDDGGYSLLTHVVLEIDETS